MKRPSQRRRRRRRAAAVRKQPFSLTNPPTGRGMSVEELSKLTGKSLKTSYKKVNAGFYPSIRLGRGQITVLTEPTMAILRGEREPGPLVIPTLGIGHNGGPPLDDEAPKLKPRKQAKPKRRVPRKRNPKPAAKKGEVTAVAP